MLFWVLFWVRCGKNIPHVFDALYHGYVDVSGVSRNLRSCRIFWDKPEGLMEKFRFCRWGLEETRVGLDPGDYRHG